MADNKYQRGKIYKLVLNDLVYIGSTCQALCARKAGHGSEYKRWVNGKVNFNTSYLLYDQGEPKIVLIENVPCSSKEELHAREQHWIDNTECVNKKTAKILSPQERKEYKKTYVQKNKELLYEKMKIRYEATKENPDFKEKRKQYKQKYRAEHAEDVKAKDKAYRDANQDRIKAYREEHKAEASEYKKEWFQQKKAELYAKQKDQITCECGAIITRGYKWRHVKMKCHEDALKISL
jgi:hypothetical protein